MPSPTVDDGAFVTAWRNLARIDRSAIAPVSGAIAVLPVVALFGLGLVWWGPKTAVTLALGAHLIAVASTMRTTRSTYSLLALDAGALAVATFVGSLTESTGWLHVIALAIVCLAGGFLVSIGPQLGMIGTQTILAFLIFGRYPEHAVGALQLGALVLVGALIEVAILSVVRWPPAFRRQRDAVSAGLELLARSINASEIASTIPAGNEFDRALDLLDSPGVLARDDEHQLRSMVDEARRMRVEIAALTGLRRRLQSTDAGRAADGHIGAALGCIERDLHAVSQAVDQRTAASPSPDRLDRMDAEIQAAQTTSQPSATTTVLLDGCVAHLRALAGQLRAVEKLVSEGLKPQWHVHGYATPRTTVIKVTWNDWTTSLRANFTLASPALRHALRLGVAVPAADIVAQLIGLPRSYWVPLTVAVVLRPDFGSLFTRGISRVVGTTVGVAAAGFFIAGVHPDRVAVMVLVALTAWGAYAFYQSSFAVASTFVAAIVLLLLSVTQIDTTTTAADRVLDTALGGLLALVAYLVWPSWSSGQARMALARLVMAQQRYLAAVLTPASQDINPSTPTKDSRATLAKRARLAWTDAQATIARSRAEPTKWRIDSRLVQGVMDALRRIVQASHALRSIAMPEDGPSSLRQLIDEIDGAMAEVATALEHNGPVSQLPALRQRYEQARSEGADPAVLVVLDDIVDAVDTIGHLLEHERLEQIS